MRIELTRIYNCPTYSIGRIRVDDRYICDCVEDTDRGLDQSWPLAEIRKKKVYKMTAIPTGTYNVTLNVKSPKFSTYKYYKEKCNGYVPRVLLVPGYDGILIHCGSSAASSAGCIIVGFNTIKGKVTSSQRAWEELYGILKAASDRNEKITITITRNYKVQ
jgi:hypothetical protein